MFGFLLYNKQVKISSSNPTPPTTCNTPTPPPTARYASKPATKTPPKIKKLIIQEFFFTKITEENEK